MDCNGGISLNELLIIFKSVIMGYCKLTETDLPLYTTLDKFAKLVTHFCLNFLNYKLNFKIDVFKIRHSGRQFFRIKRVFKNIFFMNS